MYTKIYHTLFFRLQKYSKYAYVQQLTCLDIFQWIDRYFPINWKICSQIISIVPNMRAVLEEVVVHSVAYLEKQVGVNPRVAQDLIQVLAGVMHLFGQPGDAPALPLEFCPDEVADMKIVGLRYTVVCHHYRYSLSGKYIPFDNRVSNDRFLVQQKKKNYRCSTSRTSRTE